MDALVQELLDLEWQLFDNAPHAGQRSARPEDRELFNYTRSSQLAVWSPKLRASWQRDLIEAQVEGRNLINEKYIYMLERMSPNQYEKLKDTLPKHTIERLWLVDWISQVEISWQEALVKSYPHLTRSSRAIHRELDSHECVSFETFLRGELMTYSVNTLRLYASQIDQAQKTGDNLRKTIMAGSLRQLGFQSIEEAEEWMITSQ